MRYVTGIGRFLFAYSDLKDGQMLDFYLLLGRGLFVQAVVSCQTRRFNRQFPNLNSGKSMATTLWASSFDRLDLV